MTRHCQCLQLGQMLRVDSLEMCYRVTVLAAGEPGQRLVEKGDDYIVLEDATGDVRTRIPMHLIQSVVAPPEPAVAAA